MQRRERQLKQMLTTLRIKARSQVMPWDHVVCHLGDDTPSAPPRLSSFSLTGLRRLLTFYAACRMQHFKNSNAVLLVNDWTLKNFKLFFLSLAMLELSSIII